MIDSFWSWTLYKAARYCNSSKVIPRETRKPTQNSTHTKLVTLNLYKKKQWFWSTCTSKGSSTAT